MDPSRQHRALLQADCTVACDRLTRQLYATDASIYELTPLAVAFPKNVDQAASIVRASLERPLDSDT